MTAVMKVLHLIHMTGGRKADRTIMACGIGDLAAADRSGSLLELIKRGLTDS